MQLETGTTLGHYTITAKLGAGGMGEVYRARDSKLERDVAIKVLPADLADDAERLARFEREAKSLAALNHPNIATIFGFETDGEGGTHFLVMELVEGEDLADRIARGPIPVGEAIPLFVQIAEGLEAAHEKGIIHRDLKPANIKVCPDGRVKLLDFGLAKAMDPASATARADANISQSPTMTAAATIRGEIMGTAAYMSPEQARGLAVDKRTDIWAFGVCLFEAISGGRAFEGEDASVSMAKILQGEPPWERLPADSGRGVRRLLQRCLAKEPARRLRDIADARFDLEDIDSDEAHGEDSLTGELAAARRRRPIHPLALLSVAALALAGAFWMGRLSESDVSPATPMFSEIAAPEGWGLSASVGPPALSPDGRYLAFVARHPQEGRQLWLRDLGEPAPRALRGTGRARWPFWSPDSRTIGFLQGAQVKSIDLAGGRPRVLAEATDLDFSGASWGTRGSILVSDHRRLWLLPEEGGDLVELASPSSQDEWFWRPHFLPDGEHYLISHADGVYVTSLSGEEPRRLLPEGANVAFVPSPEGRGQSDGSLVYWSQGAVWSRPFDPGTLEFVGPDRLVVDQVAYESFGGKGVFAASRDRLVVSRSLGLGSSELGWVDRTGAWLSSLTGRGDFFHPRLSDSGTRVAVDKTDVDGDLWIYDLEGSPPIQVTDSPIDESLPVWLEGDQQLVFHGRGDLFMTPATGDLGDPLTIVESANGELIPTDASPDDRYLMYAGPSEHATQQLWLYDLKAETPELWSSGSYRETGARFSPNGNWIVFISNRGGRAKVWVRRLRDGTPQPVSPEGGQSPVWSRDGTEILYYSESGWLVSVTVGDRDGSELELGSPKQLFPVELRPGMELFSFDVSLDSQQFLVNRLVAQEPFTLIQNWNSPAP